MSVIEAIAIVKSWVKKKFTPKPETDGQTGQSLISDGHGGTTWGTVSQQTNLVVNEDGSVTAVFPDPNEE